MRIAEELRLGFLPVSELRKKRVARRRRERLRSGVLAGEAYCLADLLHVCVTAGTEIKVLLEPRPLGRRQRILEVCRHELDEFLAGQLSGHSAPSAK